jgi:hypothetical protein
VINVKGVEEIGNLAHVGEEKKNIRLEYGLIQKKISYGRRGGDGWTRLKRKIKVRENGRNLIES